MTFFNYSHLQVSALRFTHVIMSPRTVLSAESARGKAPQEDVGYLTMPRGDEISQAFCVTVDGHPSYFFLSALLPPLLPVNPAAQKWHIPHSLSRLEPDKGSLSIIGAEFT
jgi:hypothetical protein